MPSGRGASRAGVKLACWRFWGIFLVAMWRMTSHTFSDSGFWSVICVCEKYINTVRSVILLFLLTTLSLRFTKTLRDLQHVFRLTSAKITASIAQ